MHIVLASDDQLSPQRDEAIDAFRRGELDRCLLLADAILEHWPLEPTATMYRAAVLELLDWGVAPSYVSANWSQLEALMYGGESLLPSSDSAEQAPEHPTTAETQDMLDAAFAPSEAFWALCEMPTRREPPSWEKSHTAKTTAPRQWYTPTPTALTGAPDHSPASEWHESHERLSVELPRELRIVLDLYQQGRRKAARMWARSYLESRSNTAETRAYLRMLPGDLQRALAHPPTPHGQRPLDLEHVHTHDSYNDIQQHTYDAVPHASSQPKASTTSTKKTALFVFVASLFLAQTAALLYLWLR